MNKSIIINSKDIINTRDNLSKNISSYWKTIERMNLLSKKEAEKFRTMDLKAMYNQITQMAINRVKSKLLLNAINSNIKDFDMKNIKDTHYYTIYMLNELNEQKTHLGLLLSKHCINPSAKAKAGKASVKSEIFTHAKLTSLIAKIDTQIEVYKDKIDKFNSTASITVTLDDADSYTDTIAA